MAKPKALLVSSAQPIVCDVTIHGSPCLYSYSESCVMLIRYDLAHVFMLVPKVCLLFLDMTNSIYSAQPVACVRAMWDNIG